MGRENDLHRALEVLEREGLLLLADSSLPSVVTLVAGEPVRGSWWGHPKGNAIYWLSLSLASHRDVLVAKLVSAKVTFVHRRLWPAVVSVGSARQAWQLDGLPPEARALLDLVTADGAVRTDLIEWSGGMRSRRLGEAARELERRLLVHVEEVHTDSGAHAKVLETWEAWASQAGLSLEGLDSERAMRELEALLVALNERYSAQARLPWQATATRRPRTPRRR